MKSCGPCGASSVDLAQACHIRLTEMWLDQPFNTEVGDQSTQT
jgi:hypothetical protein